MRKNALNNSGFTLVEVMVASVILFSVIAAGSMGLKTSLDNMSKTLAVAYIAESLHQVVQDVKTELLSGKTEGRGTVDKRISYSFSAEKKDSGKNILSSGDLFSTDLVYGNFELTLYSVELLMTARVHGKINQRKYAYKELVWVKDGI